MRVELNMTNGCDFPKLCPCCLGAADRTENVQGSAPAGVYEATASIDVPVCSACLAHRREGRAPALIIVGTGAALLLLAFLVKGLFDPRRGSIGYVVSELLAMLWALSLVLALIAYFWVRWKWPGDHPPHVRTGTSVKVAPNPGVANWVLFEFANEQYGQLFREANASRLTGIGTAGKAGH
jgi:hypothetical protein